MMIGKINELRKCNIQNVKQSGLKIIYSGLRFTDKYSNIDMCDF